MDQSYSEEQARQIEEQQSGLARSSLGAAFWAVRSSKGQSAIHHEPWIAAGGGAFGWAGNGPNQKPPSSARGSFGNHVELKRLVLVEAAGVGTWGRTFQLECRRFRRTFSVRTDDKLTVG